MDRVVTHSPLHRFAQFTAVMTLLLILAGGLVTSTDSGLAVPDWPLSYGTLFPPMVGGIRFEHTHRLIAGVVAILIAILAVWLRREEPRRWVRRVGYAALGGVLLQALLGGVTVLRSLPPQLSIAHACLGQVIFCLTAAVAYVTAPRFQMSQLVIGDKPLPHLCLWLTALLLIQLFLGAVVRHTGLGVVPHMISACVVLVMATVLVVRFLRLPSTRGTMRRMIAVLAIAIVAQIALGGVALMHRDSALITTAHQGLGALILATSFILTVLAVWGGS